METFKNIVEKNTLYEIYTDSSDSRRFDVGYIIGYNDDWALIERISPDGLHDGYRLTEMEAVIRLQYNTQYLGKIANLAAAKGTERKPLNLPESSLFVSVLEFISTNRFVCTLELIGERGYTESGFIEEIGVDTIRLAVVDSYGKPDGTMVTDLDDVSCVTFNSGDELNLAILNLFNK